MNFPASYKSGDLSLTFLASPPLDVSAGATALGLGSSAQALPSRSGKIENSNFCLSWVKTYSNLDFSRSLDNTCLTMKVCICHHTNVRVTDVNDNAPIFVGAPFNLSLSEMTVVGSRILMASSTGKLFLFSHDLESTVLKETKETRPSV